MAITKSIDKNLLPKDFIFGKFGLLSILIITGTIFRFCYPFFSQPLDHFFSDPGRHYSNATSCFNETIYSWLDPPLPQFLLRGALTLFCNTRLGTSTYMGLLCAITPWCWYLWRRQLFSGKEKALIYLAGIVWLPSWIGIFGYFMDETMLLPVLGIALWLSWKASKEKTTKALLLAVLAWAFALSIKVNSLMELLIVLPWLFFNFIKHNGYKLRSYLVISGSLLILAITYLIYPYWVYQGLGSTWLYPPGMGVMTKAFYLSGAYSIYTDFVSHNNIIARLGEYECDSMQLKSFEPFSDWRTWRHDQFHLIVNCDKKLVFTPDMPHLSWQKRLLFIVESAIYFFFSRSWPDLREDDLIHIAQVETRWLWSLLTISIIGLAWQKNRFKDMVVVLCLGCALLYIFCESTTMTGRYRKPWEGIAIAAFIYLFNAPKAKASRTDSLV